MGAVFAAAARAPITAVIIIFELTGDYRIILPLMFAIVVATALSGALSRDTIYTLKLRRRGIDIDRPQPAGLMAQITVAEAMGKPPRPGHDPISRCSELVKRFASRALRFAAVVDDATGPLLGVIAAVDVERALDQGAEAAPIWPQLWPAPRRSCGPTDSLEDAVHALGGTDDDGIPVLGERWPTDRLAHPPPRAARLPRAIPAQPTCAHSCAG